MRGPPPREHRSFIRLAVAEDGDPRGWSAKACTARPCLKYSLALASAFVLTAVALGSFLRRRPLGLSERGAISRVVSTNQTVATSCRVADDLKVNCGHAGITQSHCMQKGCCYSPTKTPGIPWCFVAREDMDAACTVPRQDKVDCGFLGIGKERCEARGCCYANAGAERVPWCFQKPGKTAPPPRMATPQECAVPGQEKVECGFVGITEQQCTRKGCCYRHTGTVGEPDCYKRWHTVTGRDARESEECGALESGRFQCGFKGISVEQCRSRGCCFEWTGHPDVPFCFQRTTGIYQQGDLAIAEGCSVPDSERYDCGFEGMTAADCRARGCCYAPAEKPGAPYCFYKALTEAGDPVRSSGFKGHLLRVLAGLAVALAVLLLFCLAARCAGGARECGRAVSCSSSLPLAGATRCRRLEPSEELYTILSEHFKTRWDTRVWPSCHEAVPAPPIKEIYELESEAQVADYEARRSQLLEEWRREGDEGDQGPKSEPSCFFGARRKCVFRGTPCKDASCTACQIVQEGHFGPGVIGSAPSIEHTALAGYKGGMRFAHWAHTAKGQGLAPGKRPPPLDTSDFVSVGAGNVVFVADVLLGTPEVLLKPSADPLPVGTHSRVADPATGVDEVVIYERSQALPRAMLVFEDQASTSGGPPLLR